METRAVVLSLGLLLEKVDFDPFIKFLKEKIQADNKEIQSQELNARVMQGLGLAAKFNLTKPAAELKAGTIPPEAEEFRQKLFAIAGIKSLSAEDFWKGWSQCVVVGELEKRLEKLQKFAENHKCIFYLYSDTNMVDTARIAAECKSYDISKHPGSLKEFPVYTSFRSGLARNKLVEDICAQIEKANFKKTPFIVLGHHTNITNPLQSADEQGKNKHIEAFATDPARGIPVIYHYKKNSLEQTLENYFVCRELVEGLADQVVTKKGMTLA